MNPLLDTLPPEAVREIVEVLRHFETSPHGPWEPIWPLYEKWREVIRADGCDWLDHAGTMQATPGLSSFGRLFLMKHGDAPYEPDAAATEIETAAVPLTVALGHAGDLVSWEEYKYDGKFLTPHFCKERFGVTGHDLSSDTDAKHHRRPNPGGRQGGGDYVYRYKDVSAISNRKDMNNQRRYKRGANKGSGHN